MGGSTLLKLVRLAFPLIGAGLLIGAAFTYRNTASFLAEAEHADGVVIDLYRSRSGDSNTTRPVVRFTAADGEQVEFTSSFGSNPPAYSRGDEVRVLYRPSRPHDAEIDGFFALWGVTSILGGIGAVFLIIGIVLVAHAWRGNRNEQRLRQQGVPIETEFSRVELNTALRMNGRHPFQVLTRWQNPGTGKLHEFRSGNLWFDPTSQVAGRRIKVFIERNNPAKYFVDLSFLRESTD